MGDAKGWHYSINYGPEGEANYANVYTGQGDLVGNLRTHHAVAVVRACNAYLAQSAEIARLSVALAAAQESITAGHEVVALRDAEIARLQKVGAD